MIADSVVLELKGATNQYEDSLKKAENTFDKTISSIGKKSEEAVGLTSSQLQNVTYQINDLAQVLLTGGSPFRAIIQQGSQIVQVFGPGTGVVGALKSVGGALTQFLANPLTLATVGFAVATQAAYALFDAITASGPGTEAVLKANADYVDSIRERYGAAAKAALDFKDAQDKLGDIATGMERQKETAAALSSELEGLAGQIQVITSDYGAANDFGPYLDVLKKFQAQIEDGTVNVGNLRDAMQKVATDPATTDGMRKRVKEILDMIDAAYKLEASLFASGRAFQFLAGRQSVSGQKGQTQIGVGTKGTYRGDDTDQPDDVINRGNDDVNRAQPKAPKKETLDAYQRATKAIRENTAEVQASIDTFGKSTFEIEKHKAMIQLEQAALEAHKKLTAEDRANIDTLSTAYAKQVEILEQMELAQEKVQAAANEAFSSVRQGLLDIIVHGKDAVSVISDLLGKLADMLANAAFTALFQPGKNGGPLGGLFDAFGSLFGGGGGGGGGLGSVLALGGGARAGGGLVEAGKIYTVGEKGPERFVPRVPGRIIANGAGGGGMTFPFSPVLNMPGADSAAVAAALAGVRDLHRTFESRTVKAVKAAQQNRVL